ncbi:DUF1345 domain-containing protein [Leucobacter sp. CSA1]|uniref:DUF1345 domain-containing protein n=1 Tax=Leucobacter chromiisoli TaxID=2796471 RepID=A0A934Q960_9MICO|nr:DUF1345 domain-containing protein [Leucobacter chromiisoli]MBK0420176.1 DUF1345 domain-containing protein [Leucobacter chromiisoli]
MKRRGRLRKVPLPYDDGFRGGIASFAPTFAIVGWLFTFWSDPSSADPFFAVALFCASWTVFSLVYILWTHRLFSRTPPAEAERIAAVQHRRGPSRLSRSLGFGDTASWTMSAATVSLLAAIMATVLGRDVGGLWFPLLVIVTAAASWATMVYAFALRYFRLHAAGERIDFEIEESPEFIDFVSMSVMISSVGAMSAGTPRTREGLSTVRTQTYLGFAFNALVVAMVVSLVSGLVATR